MTGVIDIGSNTVRLAVYEVKDGVPKELFNKKVNAELANYIDDGKLTQKGMKKAAATLSDLLHVAQSIGLKKVYPFATASLRNVKNSKEAQAFIEEKCGVSLRILSGEEEAEMDYLGAIKEHPSENGIICDVGGGSTEIAFFQNNALTYASSFPIGSLNLFCNHVKDILPTMEEVYEIRADIVNVLRNVKIPEALKTGTISSVGGSARAIKKILEDYDPDSVHGSTIPLSSLEEYLMQYLRDPEAQAKKVLSVVPDRIHTVIPGMLIHEMVALKAGAKNLLICSSGVREGYIRMVLEGKIK